MRRWIDRAGVTLVGFALAACLGACEGQPQGSTQAEPEPEAVQVETSEGGDAVVASDGTTAPAGTVIEDDFAPDSLPVEEGDEVTMEGTLAYETFEHKGTVECLILVVDEPFDAIFGTYPNENEPTLHEGVTCVDVSPLLYDGTLDATAAGRRVRVSGTFWGSSKMNGAHYDESGAFQINGGCTLHYPVLRD